MTNEPTGSRDQYFSNKVIDLIYSTFRHFVCYTACGGIASVKCAVLIGYPAGNIYI
jgi:hypothetical protein